MTTETVKFDVGGTKYRVSRSLIEQYPESVLARMVSDTWQDDPEKELFVERDGLRFRCVLDYMRDKKVHVPVGVSKAAVLQDLEYFGFTAIPDGAIDMECADNSAASHHKKLMIEITSRGTSYCLELVAFTCYLNYLNYISVVGATVVGRRLYVTLGEKDFPTYGFSWVKKVVSSDANLKQLPQYLAKHGLHYSSMHSDSNSIKICLETSDA